MDKVKMVSADNIVTSYRDDGDTTARHKEAQDGVEPRLYPTHSHGLSPQKRDFSFFGKVSSGFVSRTSASRGPASKTGQSTLGPIPAISQSGAYPWDRTPPSVTGGSAELT